MLLQRIRASLASWGRQPILIAAFCVVSIYSPALYGEGELPISAIQHQRAPDGTAGERGAPLPGGPVLLFGLLGLAVIVAALSVRMVCSSEETQAASPASPTLNEPEQRVLSHFT